MTKIFALIVTLRLKYLNVRSVVLEPDCSHQLSEVVCKMSKFSRQIKARRILTFCKVPYFWTGIYSRRIWTLDFGLYVTLSCFEDVSKCTISTSASNSVYQALLIGVSRRHSIRYTFTLCQASLQRWETSRFLSVSLSELCFSVVLDGLARNRSRITHGPNKDLGHGR